MDFGGFLLKKAIMFKLNREEVWMSIVLTHIVSLNDFEEVN